MCGFGDGDKGSLMELEVTKLFSKVYGCLLGGAVGDALGGPVEGWDYQRIAREFGQLDQMLPYSTAPSEHGAFGKAPGTYTDDTRLKHILCDAIVAKDGAPDRGDLARACADYYYAHADNILAQGFIEEYFLKGLYGERKLIFGGQPTNGAIMMNSPIGLVDACDPRHAAADAFEIAFITDGYAKYSAAMMAAAIAAAMKPDATVDSVISDAIDALNALKVEGPFWRRSGRIYQEVGLPNERAVETAIKIAQRERDVFKLPPLYYDVLARGPLFAEATQTLAVALGMFVAADGDPRLTIMGAVAYGRDNDSYASIGGALAGAYSGAEKIPREWGTVVQEANPEPDLRDLALKLAKIVTQKLDAQRTIISDLARLVE
jgi:ADP-ribosylglycohydrolase